MKDRLLFIYQVFPDKMSSVRVLSINTVNWPSLPPILVPVTRESGVIDYLTSVVDLWWTVVVAAVKDEA